MNLVRGISRPLNKAQRRNGGRNKQNRKFREGSSTPDFEANGKIVPFQA
jgi:hypothetical protein